MTEHMTEQERLNARELELLKALRPEDIPHHADGARLLAEGRDAELQEWVDSQLRFILDYLREGMAEAMAEAEA